MSAPQGIQTVRFYAASEEKSKPKKKSKLSKFSDLELIDEITKRGYIKECDHKASAEYWSKKYLELLDEYSELLKSLNKKNSAKIKL
jgi:hypothetical protein